MQQEHITYTPRVEPMPEQRHIVWKTVFVGEGIDAAEARRLFAALRVDVSEAAARLIERIYRDHTEGLRAVKLTQKTVAELGFRRTAQLREVRLAWVAQGLALCPRDTAIAMRSEYSSLPDGQCVKVVSQPLHVGGIPCIFAITRRAAEIQLDAIEIRLDDELLPQERLVLAKPHVFPRAD